MKATHLVGLFLWRGGLLLLVASGLYESSVLALKFIDLPAQLEIGLGLCITGAALVILSLILERMQDRRTEGDLEP